MKMLAINNRKLKIKFAFGNNIFTLNIFGGRIMTPSPNVCLFFLIFIYLFLERSEGREKERDRKIHVWLPLMWPPLETWPVNQACALTGN